MIPPPLHPDASISLVSIRYLILTDGCCPDTVTPTWLLLPGWSREGRRGPGQRQVRAAAAAVDAPVPHLSLHKELPVRCPGSPGAHRQGHATLFTVSPTIPVAAGMEKKRKHSQWCIKHRRGIGHFQPLADTSSKTILASKYPKMFKREEEENDNSDESDDDHVEF